MNPPDPHNVHEPFGYHELQALVRLFQAGDTLMCPKCEVPMDANPVPQRTDVSYVRDRVWATCPGCHRGAVLDHREDR